MQCAFMLEIQHKRAGERLVVGILGYDLSRADRARDQFRRYTALEHAREGVLAENDFIAVHGVA